MNPLDRINQLNNEVALLRSQLSDARKQLEADSATIAKLAKDKRELVDKLSYLADYCSESVKECCAKNGGSWNWGSLPIEQVRDYLSRHA